jgi:hypothetical protein
VKLLLFFLGVLAASGGCGPARAQEALPGAGFDAARYEALWKQSPFAVATPEAGPSSPDYALVGVAQFDHVSYASLVDRHTQEHFVVSSEQPSHGVVLLSIIRDADQTPSSAALRIRGDSQILPLESASKTVHLPGLPGPAGAAPAGAPPGLTGLTAPPTVRFHRPILHIPPPPSDSDSPH